MEFCWSKYLNSLLLAIFVFFHCANIQSSAENLFYRAENRLPYFEDSKLQCSVAFDAFMRAGRYQKAIELLTSTKIKSEEVFFKIRACEYLNGDFNSLINASEKWLTENTASAETKSLVWEFIGSSFCNLKKPEEAVAAFTTAINLSPTPYAFAGRARAYAQLNDEKFAIADLEKARFGIQKADSLHDMLKFSAAQTYTITPAIEVFKDSRSANLRTPLILKAMNLEKEGHFDRAVALYEKAITLNKSSSLLHEALGLCSATAAADASYAGNGLDNEKFSLIALNAYKEAINLDNSNWEIWNNFALLLLTGGDYKGAEAAFETALKNMTSLPTEQPRIKRAISVCKRLQQAREEIRGSQK